MPINYCFRHQSVDLVSIDASRHFFYLSYNPRETDSFSYWVTTINRRTQQRRVRNRFWRCFSCLFTDECTRRKRISICLSSQHQDHHSAIDWLRFVDDVDTHHHGQEFPPAPRVYNQCMRCACSSSLFKLTCSVRWYCSDVTMRVWFVVDLEDVEVCCCGWSHPAVSHWMVEVLLDLG